MNTAISNSPEGLVIDIYSETGIGETSVLVPTMSESTPMVIRLHLRGLEGWRFVYEDTSIIGSVGTGDGSVSESVQSGDALDTPIDEASPYWMAVAHVEGEAGGYYELRLPDAFIEREVSAFTISFVDFYR